MYQAIPHPARPNAIRKLRHSHVHFDSVSNTEVAAVNTNSYRFDNIPVIPIYPLSFPEGPILAWNVVLSLAKIFLFSNG